jgi:hypothetical protein
VCVCVCVARARVWRVYVWECVYVTAAGSAQTGCVGGWVGREGGQDGADTHLVARDKLDNDLPSIRRLDCPTNREVKFAPIGLGVPHLVSLQYNTVATTRAYKKRER